MKNEIATVGLDHIAGHLTKATQNGRGLSGDQVNTIKYWDVEKGGYRSLRYENLIQVF